MRKLTKAEAKEKDELLEKLRAAEGRIEDAMAILQTRIDEIWEKEVQPAVEAYNDIISEANSFREDIAAKMEDYFSEKSERWQESDVGCDFQEWMSSWQDELDECDVEKPESFFDASEMTAGDDFEALSEELEGTKLTAEWR